MWTEIIFCLALISLLKTRAIIFFHNTASELLKLVKDCLLALLLLLFIASIQTLIHGVHHIELPRDAVFKNM